MASSFFSPGGLDPVLDGGEGDEDPVVAPQVPLGRLVRQPVLGDEPDGQVLDAAGVAALGPGQVGQLSREEEVAVGAVMPGEGDDEVDGAAGPWVAQVAQGARGDGVAAGTAATARAVAGLFVAAAPFGPGPWEGPAAGGPPRPLRGRFPRSPPGRRP